MLYFIRQLKCTVILSTRLTVQEQTEWKMNTISRDHGLRFSIVFKMSLDHVMDKDSINVVAQTQ